MSQQELKLIGRIDGPSFVPTAEVEKIKTYTDAVIACWIHRRSKGMTKAMLAALTGMRPSHVSDYLNPNRYDSKGRERREMPGKYRKLMEAACGNTFITQWNVMDSDLHIAEVMMAEAA